MTKQSNRYVYIFIFLLLITGILFYVNSEIAFQKIEKIKDEKYQVEAAHVQDRIKTLITEKQNTTLSIALVLASDQTVKKILTIADSVKVDSLARNALSLSEHSDYKNVWFQIINNKGVSVYRSWTPKKGDSLLEARLNVKKMINSPEVLSTISTGKFDMTFKSMIPVFDNKEFIGLVEVITHFNSIAKKLAKSNIDPVILVDKRYKKQIIKPFTNMFIDDYYVANMNAKSQLMSYIKEKGVDNFANKKNYYIDKNYFVSFFHLPDLENKEMGHFIFFQDINSIDISEIESFKFVSQVIFLTLLAFFIFGIVVIIFIARKNQIETINKTLAKNNEKLEKTVQEEIEKNKKKNMLLEKQNRLVALGEMLENIAHQWRQPLSAISTSASGLKLRYEFNDKVTVDEVNECLDAIVDNTKHLSMTIDDFRNFFKKDKEKKDFNLAKTIRKTFKIIKALYQSKSINISFDLDEDIQFKGYEREFSQVIINLFNNAKDALENNKTIKNRAVTVSLHKNEEEAILIIKDNAGGVPEKIREQIFDPYFTTKHKSQGTGIGLYMCQEIIIDHFNGTIQQENNTMNVNDTTYKGASFIIKLPL